jgi:heme/copper-type cytochrome/quinol oxidase subunit 2
MNFRCIIRGASAILLVMVVVVTVASVAEACPSCERALAQNNPAQNRVAQGYFWSILFMMAMPFTIVGTFGTCAYFQIRRARSDAEKRAELEGPVNSSDPTR